MTEEVIQLDDVWKIFGTRAEEAMQAIKSENLSKPEILEKFGCVVGRANVSFTVEPGEGERRIDYIFVSNDWTVSEYAVQPVDYSDHRPVTATLTRSND